ncbi:MAG: hypothetical protein H7833_15320 [Magnetococcus sp. DMHC-1]|nr:hypothetical protein [Magnetococcales bacterium]
MNQKYIDEAKIESALQECLIHRSRLHGAWQEAALFMSMPTTTDIPLDEMQIRVLDQVVYRFGKLQDTLAMRLLPALLRGVAEWQEKQTFLDRLNRAEQLGVIPSAEGWLRLRELRNQLTHEYPEHSGMVMAGLRLLMDHVPVLEAVHDQMVTWKKAR